MSDLISRQAVTKFLNDWLSCLFENCHKQSASDLKMIIKDFKNLPSAQPETNCSEIPNSSDTISRQLLSTNLAEVGTDCISRQQAIDALGELPTFTQDWSYNTWMYTDDVYNAIKQLPPIQPKRGRWHYSDGKPARIGLSFGVICDQCGTESEYCTNFCGECGSDMREVTT